MAKRKLEEGQQLHDGGREAKKPKHGGIPPVINGMPPVLEKKPIDPVTQDPVDSEPERDRKVREHARKLAKRQRRQEKSEAKAKRPRTAQVKGVDGGKKEDSESHVRGGEVKEMPDEDLQDSTTKDQAQYKHAKGRERKQDKVQKRDSSTAWNVSEVFGGRMLDLDPLFSPNEEYLLIAYEASVNVYATATSLLVRSLRLSHSERLSAFVFSSTDPSQLYTATRNGVIQSWDWLDRQMLQSWASHFQISALASSMLPSNHQDSAQLVFTIGRKGVGPWRISAHRLDRGAENGEVVTLRNSKEPISSFRVIEHGKVIVATSGSVLTLGLAEGSEETSFSDLSYTWRDIECSEWISCMDVRVIEAENSRSSKTSRLPRTDIVVGGLKGSLHVYDDLLNQLARKDKKSGKGPAADWTPRKLHWHRNTVLSVKWSRDGNYIVSGGLETVMLLWQLETGSHTTLPHLGASLEGIVVSPSGSSYAIRLADNSVMILSTAELKPTFSVAGIQLPADTMHNIQLPYLPSIDVPLPKSLISRQLRFPVVSGPLGVLCAVPGATASRLPSMLPQHAPYLQTFDITSAHQISRQALTRTKATDLNIGPESNTIEEPNIVLMQLSHDGQWLATVDEWMPPKRDLTIVTHDVEQTTKELRSRKEIYMKFWSWNNDAKLWELVSRIDDLNAHGASTEDEEYRILDLASNPTSNSFATVGSDGFVRIWVARARERHGSVIKNDQGQKLVNWHCRSIILIDPEVSPQQIYTRGRLAYSADGSCLAAACSSSLPWTVHLIDTQRSTVRTGPYGPHEGPLYGLGIIDRYLVMLSEQLLVWNLVSQRLAYGFTLSSQHSKLNPQDQSSHLAVDAQGGTFAVGLPTKTESQMAKGANYGSEIILFEPANPIPIFVQKLPQSTTSLNTLYNRPGYFCVDSAAEIRTFTPRQSRLDINTALPTPPATPSRGLQEIYGNSQKMVDSGGGEIPKQFTDSLSALSVEPRAGDQEFRVVPPERLAEIFDVGPAYAMPPVTDLFERVALLFAGKRKT